MNQVAKLPVNCGVEDNSIQSDAGKPFESSIMTGHTTGIGDEVGNVSCVELGSNVLSPPSNNADGSINMDGGPITTCSTGDMHSLECVNKLGCGEVDLESSVYATGLGSTSVSSCFIGGDTVLKDLEVANKNVPVISVPNEIVPSPKCVSTSGIDQVDLMMVSLASGPVNSWSLGSNSSALGPSNEEVKKLYMDMRLELIAEESLGYSVGQVTQDIVHELDEDVGNWQEDLMKQIQGYRSSNTSEVEEDWLSDNSYDCSSDIGNDTCSDMGFKYTAENPE